MQLTTPATEKQTKQSLFNQTNNTEEIPRKTEAAMPCGIYDAIVMLQYFSDKVYFLQQLCLPTSLDILFVW